MLLVKKFEDKNDKIKIVRQHQQDLNDLKKEIDQINVNRNIEANIRHGLEKKIVELQEQLKNAELKLRFVSSR